MANTTTLLLRAITNDGTQDVLRKEWSVTVPTSVLDVDTVELATGPNVLTSLIPDGATFAILDFTGNAVAIVLEGQDGDQGIALGAPSGPVLLPLAGTGFTSLALDAAAPTNVTVYWC